MLSKRIKSLMVKAMVMTLIISSATFLAPNLGGEDGELFAPTLAMAAEASGKVTVTCSTLWTYSRADWAAHAKVVYQGNSFNIVETLTVSGRVMYKLDNGLYITGNTAYVSVSSLSVVAPVVSSGTMETTANLYMRSGPGTGYEKIKLIPQGTRVQVSSMQNGWYQFTYGGTTGWSSGSYLKAVTTTPVPAVTTSYKRTTANLNMRKGPSTAESIISTIPNGTKVETSSVVSGWYEVTYNGKTGWVSGQYLTSLSSTYSEKVLKIPYINQYSPLYAPMGCEGASLLMALQYKGYTSVGLKTFLDGMPKTVRNPFGGFSSTPYAVVQGNPPIFQSIFPIPLTAYGKTYNTNVTNFSGYGTDHLKREIDNGNPVVVFVTNANYAAPVWKVYDMGDAGMVNMVNNMHVMVLTGYDSEGNYHVTDPAGSSASYWVSKSKFEAAYNALKWAVVVR